jgi:MoxR-like ATPase
LCNGHILLEGVPGLAKTTLVNTISQAIGLDCKRIQFTPDLLPADVVGTQVYNPKSEEFTTKKGPLFANLVLADEINRAPAKVQSALLEAMQERQVTIGDDSFKLPAPFFVLATQNPIDQEGTYQLPEAQMDRFLLKVVVGYPTVEEEKSIINSVFEPEKVSRVITTKEIKATQDLVKQVYIDDKVIDYLLSIIFATRNPENYGLETIAPYITHGASPRATLALYHTAKAYAFLKKRHFVIPDDIKAVAPDVLRHRILLSYNAEAEGLSSDEIIQTIVRTIVAP